MEQEKLNTNQDWALYYLGFGWNPIPVEGKKPLVQWKEYQDKKVTPELIKQWWTHWPNANIAIITGKISGIVAVDIDPGGQMGYLSPTVSSKTGRGGTHCIYKYPKNGIGCATGIRPHVDFRGDGGYIVVPPSRHENGNVYEWLISPNTEDIAELPPTILALVKPQSKSKNWNEIGKGVSEGQRNETAASYIGKILSSLSPDMWESAGWDAIWQWNLKCSPPLDHTELRTILESSRSRAFKSLLTQNEDYKALYARDKKTGSYKIAQFLANHHHIKTTDEKNRELYVYQDGMYKPGGNFFGTEIQKILEELCTTQGKKEIIEKIKDFTLCDRTIFDVDTNYINLKNGIYVISEEKLISHNPVYAFLTQIPIQYNPSAACPIIQKFLEEILNPEDVLLVQEWAGYALYRKYPIKKAIIFVGEKDTGKTTLISLLTRFIGESNVAGIALQKLSSDKFSAAHLYAKHINIYDDLSAKDISDNGVFKIATGGGYITGEYKFGNQFTFLNHAKLTFACNKIPNVKDTNDDAYFSRWLILQFNKQIENPDKLLLEKITTAEELSGFFNFALVGLKRVLGKQRFSYTKDPDEIKAEMLKSGSPIANFAYDYLERADSEWISKEDLYKIFERYIAENQYPATSIENFGKQLPKYADYITDGKHEKRTGWRNVRIKSGLSGLLSTNSQDMPSSENLFT